MKALALVEGPDHVCCRYRVRAFEPALRDAGWSLEVRGLASNPVRRAVQLRGAARFDAVLLQRKLLPAWQVLILRRHARRLVFDFDDAVLYRDSYDPRGPLCPRRAARFALMMAAADRVVAGNDFLADCAQQHGATADRVRVIPTCVDPTRYRPEARRAGGGLTLAWVGSSSTLKGLERERGLLERIGRDVPGARLRLICDRSADFGPLTVEPVAWSEATEARAIAGADVGISLVPDDLWSRGKCGLKVIQYQAAGLPVVANPVGVHPRMIEPGINGELAGSPDAWVRALRGLAADPPLRDRMGRAARAAVEARYSVASWAPAFLGSLAGSGPVGRPPREARGASGGARRADVR